MNGNKKLFLRLALVVILAVSFLTPMAVGPKPASAVTAGYAVALAPATGGANASYTIGPMTAGAAAWVAGATTIAVTFPAGTIVPAAIGAATVTVNGTPVGVAPGIAGLVVTITSPVAVAIGGPATVVFTAASGIVNPPAAGGLNISVTIAAPAEAASLSAAYATTAFAAGPKISLSTLNASNAQGLAGLPMWIAGTGFTGGETVAISSPSAAVTVALATKYNNVQSNNLGVGAATPTANTLTADALGNFVVAGTVTTVGAGAIATTINAVGTTSGAGYAAAFTVASAASGPVPQQVKITSGLVIAYADQLNVANVASFAHVGDAFTVQAANTGCAVAGAPAACAAPGGANVTLGDFTAGGAMTVIFDGTVQPLLGNITVDPNATQSGINNPTYKTFNTTVLVPTATGGSLATGSGNFPGSGKTVKVTDGVFAIIFNFNVAPKSTFSPNSGGQGATITVTGTGFSKAKGITLYSSPVVATTAALGTAVSTGAITTDATGSFSGTFAALTTTKYISVVDGNGSIALNVGRSDSSGNTFSAKPTITVSPTSGTPTSTITLTGSNYNGGVVNFEAFFGTQPAVYVTPVPAGPYPVAYGGGWLVAAGALDGAGNIPAGVTFTVPGVTQGSYQVYVIDNGAASKNQNTAFTVGALTLTATPTSSPRYGKVTITVASMTNPGGTIPPGGVTIGGVPWNVAGNLADSVGVSTVVPIGQITLDASGNATFTMRVPAAVNYGAQQVLITDSGALQTQNTITVVQPSITLTPATAPANSTVAVTGKGWVPSQNVTITFTNGASVTNVTGTPDGGGVFGTTFTVPTGWTAGSTGTVTATDTKSTAPTLTLPVPSASITVTPSTVNWGQTVTVTGTGFPGGAVINVRVPWSLAGAGSVFPNTVYSDNLGNFTGTFVMPSITTGIQSIGAVDSNATTNATATITVNSAATTPAQALATISQQLVRCWAFDAPSQTWQLYDPSVPAALNTLAGLNKGQGYFINVTAATSIITGSGNIVNLAKGWNLIGW